MFAKNKYKFAFLVGILIPVLVTLLGLIVWNLGSYYINEILCPQTLGYEDKMCGLVPGIIILPIALLVMPAGLVATSLFGLKSVNIGFINAVYIMGGAIVLGMALGVVLVILQKFFDQVSKNENRKPRRHT